jgi:hypothetical protein
VDDHALRRGVHTATQLTEIIGLIRRRSAVDAGGAARFSLANSEFVGDETRG